MEEIEVKFLNVDPRQIQKKLKKIGAKKMFEKLYKRRVFDFPDLRFHEQGAWLRVRDEGDKVTMTWKQRIGMKTQGGEKNDESMEEVGVVVSDLEKVVKIIKKLGLVETFYEENKRIRYVLDDIEFDIDTWPMLEPYLEIEAKSWKDIDKAVKLLGFDPKDKKIFSTYQIYQLKGIDENDYKVITFDKIVKKQYV